MLASAATISVTQTLALLDNQFAEVAKGITEDQYAFWLGSGISFGRLPGLKKLIGIALEHLRTRVSAGDADCRFRAAIDAAFAMASLGAADRAAINLEDPVSAWPARDV